MIVTQEQLKEKTGVTYYDGSILHSRFAYKFYGKDVKPTGNIISYISPTVVETEFMIDLEDIMHQDFIYSKSMMNFCYELPCTNLFGGVAFQRLFNNEIGKVLEIMLGKDVSVVGDDIFVKRDDGSLGKASVSIVTDVNGAILGHVGINIEAGDRAPSFAYSTGIDEKQAHIFMSMCMSKFRDMTQDIFVATTKVI